MRNYEMKIHEARTEFMRTLLDRRAKLSPRTDADQQDLKERN